MKSISPVAVLQLMVFVGALGTGALWAGPAGAVNMDDLRTPLYTVDGDAFVRHNGGRFNNRSLYCNQIPAIVVAGDRPLLRFGNDSILNGTFLVALARGNKAKWLLDCSDITSKYRPGRMEWVVRDADFGATVITVEAVPPAEGPGLAVRLRIEGAQHGDRLIWACGGAMQLPKENMQGFWDVTTGGREKKMEIGFVPEDCRDNRDTIDGGWFQIGSSVTAKRSGVAAGRCSVPSKLMVADATAWRDPLSLTTTPAKHLPIVCGITPLDGINEVYWAVQASEGSKLGDISQLKGPARFFAVGWKRATTIGERIVADTPDPWFNAAVGASSTVMEAVYRKGIFTHSGMRWGVPLLGWRTVYGGTAYGWHERVKTQARSCLAKQITESKKTQPEADVKCGLSCQSLNSRLFGKGRVDVYHPWHYDMQTQFFDQLIHAWRWTGDAELEKMLRPALELHLEYIHDCFDPDDDGLYESYANTWPTDDQWYNGAGTAEETAYAYSAHQAAMEMARRAGDDAAVKRHAARLAKIRKNFLDKLWIPAKEHVGAYVEQGGLQRVHEDCWLYAIFCPIDAGMLTSEQAVRSLHYTEWGLQREKMPYGGERCWPSNWVPSIWSLREMWPGDNYHLALAYFQTGLADDGWTVLRGTFPHLMFFGPVPADFGYTCGGTDFNDCASMFCRTVVEGLFGYRPDYPNGVVTIAPQFPSAWDHASLKSPDFSLTFRNNQYRVEIAKPAVLDLRLPVRAKRVTGVKVNGQAVRWELQPGYGCSELRIRVPACQTATVEIASAEPLPPAAAVALEATVGDALALPPIPDTKLLEHSAFPVTAGYHLVDALVQVGDAKQRRLFKIKLNDPVGDAARTEKVDVKVPADARWSAVNMAGQFNGDIREIFTQKYLSPRPQTCSLRLASDGYSTWQMMLDPKHKTPVVDLAAVPKLLGQDRQLSTPQGVPFAWADGSRNTAFTSLWDNWPRQVTVPVNKQGDAVWFLVCGFTPPMQGRITNARLRMTYADGTAEILELVPPLNFWSLCPFGEADYNYKRDAFALPKEPPPQVQLGKNCRAMVYGWKLRPGAVLKDVTLETLSQEVIIGLLGVSVMNPK